MMWDNCGMVRTEEGLSEALEQIPELRDEFWDDVRSRARTKSLNQSLEKAGRVADFLELGELMCIDALHRGESCGGHFRGEEPDRGGRGARHDDELSATSRRGSAPAPVTGQVRQSAPQGAS